MEDSTWQLEIARPAWLAALVVLPLLIFYWRRSLVQFSPRQRIVSLALRAVLLLLMTVALCGPEMRVSSPRQFVVFAVDYSGSVREEARAEAADFIDKATAGAGENRWAVLPFAAEPGMPRNELPANVELDVEGSNAARAIAAARAEIPAGYVPHVVLLCDGSQTLGDVLAAAKAARVPVSTVPLPGLREPEVYVVAVETPGEVRQGEPFDLHVVVRSTHADAGELSLFDDGESVDSQEVSLQEGANRFTFRRSIKDRTAATLTAEIGGCKDTVDTNNRAAGVTCAPRPIRVLLVEGRGGEAGHLMGVLGGEGIDVTVCAADQTPQAADALHEYDLLVLYNVPAASLSEAQMAAVGQYVHDFGGGLIAVGGDRAFTSGEYRDTTLETILPVDCRVRAGRKQPSLAMMIVIDQSESMKQDDAIGLAKTATWQAIERLRPVDSAGVIGFEDNSHWHSQIAPCTDDEKQRMRGQIAAITAGGGTNMFPAVERAYLALNEAYAELKHMIVLTDGLSQPGDFDALTEEIAAAGITVSTIGVGSEAAPELLRRIADLGNGRYYDCDDPARIPEIFALETAHPPRAGIIEELVLPGTVDAAEVFGELNLGTAPRLLGYVQTVPKPDAHVAFAAESGDPLLAWWRYGRGTSVAFTSDMQETWAPLWLKWSTLGQFWAELVRHTMKQDASRGRIVLRAEHSHGQGLAILDAADAAGRFINEGTGTLEIVVPDQQGLESPFRQIAPGRYAAPFATQESGTYLLKATLSQAGNPVATRHGGLSITYSEEYRLEPTNESLLRQIAEQTGGAYDPEPGDVFAARNARAERNTPLWHYLLIAAVLVFVADVGLKRIELRR